jgi:type III secretory pathway component EscT
MKAGTILILTLMISVAICQPTERKQERGVVTNEVGLGVIIGIVLGVVFVVSLFYIFVSICCLPCCRVGRRC